MGWAMKGRRDGSIITAVARRKVKKLHHQPLLLTSDADDSPGPSSGPEDERTLDQTSTSDSNPTAANTAGTADDTSLAISDMESKDTAEDSPGEVTKQARFLHHFTLPATTVINDLPPLGSLDRLCLPGQDVALTTQKMDAKQDVYVPGDPYYGVKSRL